MVAATETGMLLISAHLCRTRGSAAKADTRRSCPPNRTCSAFRIGPRAQGAAMHGVLCECRSPPSTNEGVSVGVGEVLRVQKRHRRCPVCRAGRRVKVVRSRRDTNAMEVHHETNRHTRPHGGATRPCLQTFGRATTGARPCGLLRSYSWNRLEARVHGRPPGPRSAGRDLCRECRRHERAATHVYGCGVE